LQIVPAGKFLDVFCRASRLKTKYDLPREYKIHILKIFLIPENSSFYLATEEKKLRFVMSSAHISERFDRKGL
jgi:hypothetical protein